MFLRNTLYGTKGELIHNEIIRQQLAVKHIQDLIGEVQLRWFGHCVECRSKELQREFTNAHFKEEIKEKDQGEAESRL